MLFFNKFIKPLSRWTTRVGQKSTRWFPRHNTLKLPTQHVVFSVTTGGLIFALRWWKIECPFRRTLVLHGCGQVSSRSSPQTPVPRISFQKWNSGTADLSRKKISGISSHAREGCRGKFPFLLSVFAPPFLRLWAGGEKWKGEKSKRWKSEKVKRWKGKKVKR